MIVQMYRSVEGTSIFLTKWGVSSRGDKPELLAKILQPASRGCGINPPTHPGFFKAVGMCMAAFNLLSAKLETYGILTSGNERLLHWSVNYARCRRTESFQEPRAASGSATSPQGDRSRCGAKLASRREEGSGECAEISACSATKRKTRPILHSGCVSQECSYVGPAPLHSYYVYRLPGGLALKNTYTSIAFIGCASFDCAANDGALCDSIPYMKHRLSMLEQRRYVRPNRGRNDYQRLGGKKRGRGIEALPETLGMLVDAQKAEATTAVNPRRIDCFARPGVPTTEAMAVPTVADVDAPLTMLVTSGWGGRARTSTDLEYQYQCLDLRDETRIEVNYSGLRSKEATGKLDSVALNLGDISRLRVDATIFGTTPCLKVIGGGRGFVGCSSIIAGAGPMLPFFVSQQRDFLLKAGSDTSGEDNMATTWKSADAAVAALRKGIARLTTLSSQSLLQAPLSADNNIEEVSNLPFAALSAVAASAGRRCLTSGHLDERNSLQAGDESEARVFPPTSLWPSGSIMLSPGFSLPSFFLVHVVEPNAIYSNEHFFCALSRLEELQTAQKRNGERQTFKEFSPIEWSDWKAINNPAEKHLHRCCWKRMQLLENCYVEALNAAAALGVRSVATPCLGTGIGGFPTYIAARCAAKAVAWWMRTRGRKHGGHEAPLPGGDSHSLIERVLFCTTSDREWKALRYLIPAYFA